MRLLTAIGGVVLLTTLPQGCQSADYKVAYASMTNAPRPETSPPELQAEQRPDLRDQARAYAARLKRDGCVKSREGALFEAASDSFDKDLGAQKRGDSQSAESSASGATTGAATALAEARLAVGDAASASGCLDIANAQYKAVIRSFPGPGNATYRQRAELGLSASQL